MAMERNHALGRRRLALVRNTDSLWEDAKRRLLVKTTQTTCSTHRHWEEGGSMRFGGRGDKLSQSGVQCLTSIPAESSSVVLYFDFTPTSPPPIESGIVEFLISTL